MLLKNHDIRMGYMFSNVACKNECNAYDLKMCIVRGYQRQFLVNCWELLKGIVSI